MKETKRCSSCHRILPSSEFPVYYWVSKTGERKQYLLSMCRECKCAEARQRYHQQKMARTPEENAAFLAHQRELRRARSEKINAYQRAYRKRKAQTEAGKARMRMIQRRSFEHHAERSQPNLKLIEARRAAKLTQDQLADKLGVSQVTVHRWEHYGYQPRDPAVRKLIQDLLGYVFDDAQQSTDE